ncbi:hypothetical protein BsWGS_14551 [Bradybaena similaris]
MHSLTTSLGLLVCLCISAPTQAAGKDALGAAVLQQLLRLQDINGTVDREMDRVYIANPQAPKNVFPCRLLSPSPTSPTSVHRLRPGDISVVAALGDSLTTARGASRGILALLLDYVGRSWSIGGDGTYSELVTIPNILRNYNPSVYGYSEGVGEGKKRFNVAETGAKSSDAVGQAETLVRLMREVKDVDFNNSWKLVTVFIGGNDLCDYCQDENAYSAATYASNLRATLDYLQAHLPRTFVNLVELLPLEAVRHLGDNLLCQGIQRFICNCVVNPSSEEEARRAVRLREAYQKATQDLVASGRYDTRDDFTVVLQPFYRNAKLPSTPSGKVDFSYFASDCFHYSEKGQQSVAGALWTNMVEAVGSKHTAWTPGQALKCPTEEHPYLYTAKNSNTTGNN